MVYENKFFPFLAKNISSVKFSSPWLMKSQLRPCLMVKLPTSLVSIEWMQVFMILEVIGGVLHQFRQTAHVMHHQEIF